MSDDVTATGPAQPPRPPRDHPPFLYIPCASHVPDGGHARHPPPPTPVPYMCLMAGTLVAVAILPVWFAGWTIVNAGLFAIVLAEIVRCIVAAVSYRRGWNG